MPLLRHPSCSLLPEPQAVGPAEALGRGHRLLETHTGRAGPGEVQRGAGPRAGCSPREGQRESGGVPHLGGGEDDDVLDVSPGEAGPYLQHQRDHAGCQRGGGGRPRMPLRAARALLQVPVRGHLPRERGEASRQARFARLQRLR